MTQSARKKRKAPTIEVLVQSDLWRARKDLRPALKDALAKAAGLLSIPKVELAVVLSDDSAIRLLNLTWRGIDAPTNVLSFPAGHGAAETAHIGDIVLAHETIAREARARRKPFAHHVAHLAVHGFLHLLGYDHVRNKDAEIMERIEREVLRRLGICDPYRHSARV